MLNEDPSNLRFSERELSRIADSVVEAKEKLESSGNFAPAQLALLGRKLDEIESASRRLGRKDWMNYVAGSLTSVCIAAAFAPDITKRLFDVLNAAFEWLFANSSTLLLR